MFKIDQVKSVFNCDFCSDLLVDPVTLVCGNTICKYHVDKFLANSTETNKFKCEMCFSGHFIPKQGFIVNKQLQHALNMQLNNMKFPPAIHECKKIIDEALESADKIQMISQDPDSYIYECFEEIKRQVDLRREELIEKVHAYSDGLIESIDSCKLDCTKKWKESNRDEWSAEFAESSAGLAELTRLFDTFEINEKKFEDMKSEADALKEKLNQMLVDYKESLLLNKELSFVFEDQPIDEVFGTFIDFKRVNIFQPFFVY